MEVFGFCEHQHSRLDSRCGHVFSVDWYGKACKPSGVLYSYLRALRLVQGVCFSVTKTHSHSFRHKISRHTGLFSFHRLRRLPLYSPAPSNLIQSLRFEHFFTRASIASSPPRLQWSLEGLPYTYRTDASLMAGTKKWARTMVFKASPMMVERGNDIQANTLVICIL